MSGPTRFYLPTYKNLDRPVYIEDLGNHLKICGAVIQGMGSTVVLMTPSGKDWEWEDATIEFPSLDEWGEIIRRSDNPEVFVGKAGDIEKVLHRKIRYEISGATQQKVWADANFKCIYCQRKMGDVQLTVDHWISLENGGKNETSNYVSACKSCNKDKGAMSPEEFCILKGFSYMDVCQRFLYVPPRGNYASSK